MIWRAVRLRTPRFEAIPPRTGMSTANVQGQRLRSSDVEAQRKARDNRAFRPAALARRGRVSTTSGPLAPPGRGALAVVWVLAIALGALGIALISAHVDLRDLLRAPSRGR